MGYQVFLRIIRCIKLNAEICRHYCQLIDVAHHAEALIDGLILDRLDLRSAAILP